MKEVKLSYIVGNKKLSVRYYQEKNLKKVKNLDKAIAPIYFQISYNSETFRVRSILWKSLMAANNNFVYGKLDGEKSNRRIIEGMVNIEKTYINDNKNFEILCKSEFECLKRIIVFALRSDPKNVGQIVDSYTYYGQDGLREVCRNILSLLIATHLKEDGVNFEEDGINPFSTSFFKLFTDYKHLSRNAIEVLRQLIKADNIDTVSLMCFAEEIGIDRIPMPPKLQRDFTSLMELIIDLILQYEILFTVNTFETSKEIIESISVQHPIPHGLLYCPRIHFYLPIYTDPSQKNKLDKIKMIDLLWLQGYLTK